MKLETLNEMWGPLFFWEQNASTHHCLLLLHPASFLSSFLALKFQLFAKSIDISLNRLPTNVCYKSHKEKAEREIPDIGLSYVSSNI